MRWTNGSKMLLVFLSCLLDITAAAAETVIIKYRGTVDLKPFACETVTRSSFIQRVCYDQREQYMVINLDGTYYHYCEVPSSVVSQLKTAPSMGRYYVAHVKGRYDCRVKRVPQYR